MLFVTLSLFLHFINYLINNKTYLVQPLIYLTIICYIKKDKIVYFVYGIIIMYNLITFFFHLHPYYLFIFECMNAYSINYVFITDSFYLDEYYIDYMSSGNNSNFDPVKDAINTNNHNNDPNNHNNDPNNHN